MADGRWQLADGRVWGKGPTVYQLRRGRRGIRHSFAHDENDRRRNALGKRYTPPHPELQVDGYRLIGAASPNRPSLSC